MTEEMYDIAFAPKSDMKRLLRAQLSCIQKTLTREYAVNEMMEDLEDIRDMYKLFIPVYGVSVAKLKAREYAITIGYLNEQTEEK